MAVRAGTMDLEPQAGIGHEPDRVTVVIPARDEERFIGATLSSVRAQDYGNLQIIVVDNGSTDDTDVIVKQHSAEDERVELLHNEKPNIPASLNVGLAHAQGRWLVRVDAHSTVDPEYVGRAVARLREGRWGGVGGRKDGVGVTAAGRAIAAAMGSRFGVGGSTYHHGTTAHEVEHIPFGAYPVEMMRGLGGWDERLVANEDFEFDHRVREAGMSLLFDPAMVIRWHCRQSVRDLYRQYRRYGQGKVAVAVLHPESMRVRHVAPPLFVAYAVAAALLAVRQPVRGVAMMAPYGLALTAASVHTGRRLDSVGDRVRVPAAFVAMHVGWGAGFWAGTSAAIRERLRGVSRMRA